MGECVRRISGAFPGADLSSSIARSLVLSVDMAHALHPNYVAKHDKQHSPMLNKGVVIKTNNNQRYATSGETAFIIRELARGVGVPVQEFIVRNDCPCGTTIGPVISSQTGMRAIDLGMPQLSMHSIREMMGASDLTFAAKLFTSFFQGKHLAIDNQLRQSTR
jgi:aspartyl aminopeptidase